MRQIIIAVVLVAAPATAEITAASGNGFALKNVATVKATPAKAYSALGQPNLWWNGSHSYSGDAKNLSLAVAPGGCFCETDPKNGAKIEHGRVVYLKPGETLRLHAALGPLQAEGVSGALSWDIKPLPGGGAEITQTYVVGGFVRAGADKLAPLVDGVMKEQLTRLAAYLNRP